MLRIIISTLFLFVFVRLTVAQTCSQILKKAENDFEAGKLSNIPDLIEPLFDKKDCLSKEEKIRARKLITEVYIFSDKEILADEALILLLKEDPEHILDEQVDPKELNFLMSQFRTKPIFRVAIRGGVNVAKVNVKKNGERSTTSSNYAKFYNGRTSSGDQKINIGDEQYESTEGRAIGLGMGLFFEKYIKNGLEIGGGINWRVSSYHVEAFSEINSFSRKVENQQRYIQVPVFVRYTAWYDERIKHNFKPYVFMGLNYDRLVSANYVQGGRNGGTPYTLTDNLDLLESNQVNKQAVSGFVGLGFKFRVFGTHFMHFEAKYDKMFGLYMNEDNTWNNVTSTFDLMYVEDVLSIDFLSFNAGFSYSIYHPKKIK